MKSENKMINKCGLPTGAKNYDRIQNFNFITSNIAYYSYS